MLLLVRDVAAVQLVKDLRTLFLRNPHESSCQNQNGGKHYSKGHIVGRKVVYRQQRERRGKTQRAREQKPMALLFGILAHLQRQT